MNWLKRKHLLLIVGILLLSLLGYFAYVLFVQENYVVATLDAGSKREIRIWADRYIENCQPFYYEVRVNGQVISPMSLIDCQFEEPKFRPLYSKDRNLVGIIKEEQPEVLLAINDFASGETWPRPRGGESWEETLNRGRRLRDRLRVDNAPLRLELSHEMP